MTKKPQQITIFPDIMREGADISKLIEQIAPGRPCSHRLMKRILAELKTI